MDTGLLLAQRYQDGQVRLVLRQLPGLVGSYARLAASGGTPDEEVKPDS